MGCRLSGTDCADEPRTLTRERAEGILRTLAALPPEKVAEVEDLALFLKRRCEREAWVELGQWEGTAFSLRASRP